MNSTLEHHGILGMKWGVRRYQRDDGSLTPAGRKRYWTDAGLADNGGESTGKNNYSENTRQVKPEVNPDYKQAHSGKSVQEYSTKELQAVVNRLNFERQYRDLTETKKEVKNGKKIVADIFSGTGIAIGAATPIAALVGKKYGMDDAKAKEMTAILGASAGIASAVSKLLKNND